MTHRERLLLVAELLWGRRWQTAMHEETGLSRHTIVRYAGGKRAVPERLLEDLDATMVFRIGRMAAALDGLAVLMLSDGRPVAFSAAGEPVEPEGELRDRLRGVLEEVKSTTMTKEPADAPE